MLTELKSKSSKKNSKLLQKDVKLWYNDHTITEGRVWAGRRPKKRAAVRLELKYRIEGDDKYEMYYRWQKH